MRKFMRTRAPPPPAPPPPPPAAPANGHAHKTNGHANGGARRDDHHSTLSRYWSGSEGSGPAPAPAPGALWQDPQFPAAARALGDARLARAVRWMRPHELCARPRFRGDEEAAADADEPDEPDEEFAARWCVEVGEAGDGHVCCAAAALAHTPRLLARVAPPHSFQAPRYTGAFRFRFWVFGAWREVAVDDRLPTRGGRLLASRCALPDDFTLPLLEKAYAKLYGSYAALRGGSAARALQDLSGGIVQSFALRRQPRALTFQVLNSAVPRSTLLVATVQPAEGGWRRLRSGLVAGQPYGVTGLARVRGAAGADEAALALVRLRAAGARGAWAGAWAPASAEWRALPAADRELLAARADRPGDFWMSFGDFSRSFSRLELVHVGPDDWLGEPALHARRPWRAVLARRRWRAGYNAGGPPAAAETTGANPQFHVQIPRSEAAGARKCHVVVSVTQQYCPGAGGGAGGERLRAIGFAVYELPAAASPRRAADSALLSSLRPLDVTHESRAREVATFFTLPPGRYLVVPHTRRAHTDAAFLLRILTDDRTDVWEVNEDNVVVRDVPAEFLDEPHHIPAEIRATVSKWVDGRSPDEEVSGGGGAASGAARRVARAAAARAVPRAGGAARRGAGGRGARAPRAGAGGAAGLLARRLPAPRRAALRRAAPRARQLVPAARAAVGRRPHRLQQGAGGAGAALRAPRRAHRRRVRARAGAAPPRARAVPQPGREAEVQPALARGDDPDDDLLVSCAGAAPHRAAPLR